MKKSNIKKVFGKEKNILIGMIHLPPLLSIKGFSGIDKMIKNALIDLRNLEAAGFDAVLVENDNDKPHTEFGNPAQIANLTVVAYEVCKVAKVPVGVQMMLNDWNASFSIAKAVGAKFTRLDVFVDDVTCDWCTIHPKPKEIIEFKNKIYPELVLLTDIQVKYKKMIKTRPLAVSAKMAILNNTDAVIVTGSATGMETPVSSLIQVKEKFPKFPLFIGAGVRESNIIEQLRVANGAIIGTSIKTGERINLKKAKALAAKIK